MSGSVSVDEVRRLPKGHEVKIYVPYRKSREEYFKEKGISWKAVRYKNKDCMLFMAFVSGDTAENGLSVVALDNTEYCCYHGEANGGVLNHEERITRICIEEGYDDWHVEHESAGGSPVCPY